MSEERDRVREEMGKWLYENDDAYSGRSWEDLDENVRESWREGTDQILTIKGLVILSDNQELPALPVNPTPTERLIWATQQDMFDGGFKRVIKEE